MRLAKHIPNGITSLNLFCGSLAIVYAFEDKFETALLFIILSAIFDFFDGLAARALRSYSDMGKELDSLADIVSFGLAPALMGVNYLHGFSNISHIATLWPILIAVFSGLRLAKFNLDTRQTESFLGLPVPANALFFASFITFVNQHPETFNVYLSNQYSIQILSVALSLLLVSEIPMFSMKLKKLGWKENNVRYIFFIITIPVSAALYIFFGVNWTGIVSFFFLFYIVYNIVVSIFRTRS